LDEGVLSYRKEIVWVRKIWDKIIRLLNGEGLELLIRTTTGFIGVFSTWWRGCGGWGSGG
jgi:hypothetical protein